MAEANTLLPEATGTIDLLIVHTNGHELPVLRGARGLLPEVCRSMRGYLLRARLAWTTLHGRYRPGVMRWFSPGPSSSFSSSIMEKRGCDTVLPQVRRVVGRLEGGLEALGAVEALLPGFAVRPAFNAWSFVAENELFKS